MKIIRQTETEKVEEVIEQVETEKLPLHEKPPLEQWRIYEEYFASERKKSQENQRELVFQEKLKKHRTFQKINGAYF